MLTTPHTLIGLAIIKLIPTPFGLFLTFLSHFMVDFFLPHWNPHIYTELKRDGKLSKPSLIVMTVDGFLALGFLFYSSFKALPNYHLIIYYFLASFLAVLPDMIEIPYYFFKSKNTLLKKYVLFAHNFQANASMFWGITTQLLIMAAAIKQLYF